jgi:hypothetical protein
MGWIKGASQKEQSHCQFAVESPSTTFHSIPQQQQPTTIRILLCQHEQSICLPILEVLSGIIYSEATITSSTTIPASIATMISQALLNSGLTQQLLQLALENNAPSSIVWKTAAPPPCPKTNAVKCVKRLGRNCVT